MAILDGDRPLNSLSLLVSILLVMGSSLACSAFSYLTDPCSRNAGSATAGDTSNFEGYYIAQFEVSSFVPCGCSADPGYGSGYWLESEDPSFWPAYDPYRPGDEPFSRGPIVYVRFEGFLSEYGGFGHLSQYSRQVTVTELFEMSPVGTCGHPLAGRSAISAISPISQNLCGPTTRWSSSRVLRDRPGQPGS